MIENKNVQTAIMIYTIVNKKKLPLPCTSPWTRIETDSPKKKKSPFRIQDPLLYYAATNTFSSQNLRVLEPESVFDDVHVLDHDPGFLPALFFLFELGF